MSYGRPPPDVEGMTSLKVDNLTYRTSPDTLRRVFEKYGRVGDVYIPRDRYTKESRGFAFVRGPGPGLGPGVLPQCPRGNPNPGRDRRVPPSLLKRKERCPLKKMVMSGNPRHITLIHKWDLG
uniref:cDNA FLJ44468 fis, clone UTERU2026025, moderately similar to SPLICING FACTOR, ARGININE/SERINE-RICH 2 n=1 Tax=Homo sapiens TaxID=9606 RepID=B3KX15_HUMAN|nr:unnamed protein product [Homo sapiens]